jgi:hypothetical protein
MVSFQDAPEAFETHATGHVLLGRLTGTADMFQRVKAFDTRMRLDEHYNKKISGHSAEAGAATAHMDVDYAEGFEADS